MPITEQGFKAMQASIARIKTLREPMLAIISENEEGINGLELMKRYTVQQQTDAKETMHSLLRDNVIRWNGSSLQLAPEGHSNFWY